MAVSDIELLLNCATGTNCFGQNKVFRPKEAVLAKISVTKKITKILVSVFW